MHRIVRYYVRLLLFKGLNGVRPESVSKYRQARLFYTLRLTFKQRLTDSALVALGVVSAGFGLKGFLLPNGYIDGGVTGISLLAAKVSGWSVAPLLVVINLPFLMLGYTQVGRSFAFKSVLAISGLAVALWLIPYPVVTSDKLLVAVFGGFFLGAGIGLALRGGAVLDGTEIMAIFFNRRTSLSIGDVILVFNIVLFAVAAWLLGVEVALYAILTYLAASKTVDFFVEGFEEYIGVTIVSGYHEDIRRMIMEKMRHGVTVFHGMRGHGERANMHATEILYTVITRLEITKLKHEVERIDPNAFIALHSVKDRRGGIGRQRSLPGH